MNETVLGQIFEHVKENPSHGCDRIVYHIEAAISAQTIQRYLNAWNLGTQTQRRAFHRCQNGDVLTKDELSK